MPTKARRVTRYRLKTIASGTKAGFWVSLGFTSAMKRNDVLHIVSAPDPDRRSRRRLYVERFDQLYSCEGGADSVRVGPHAVEIHLTPRAAHRLSFESTLLSFEFERRPAGYANALRTFRSMAEANGRVRILEEA